MKRRKVEAREMYTWGGWTPGTVLDGVYQGKREVETVNGPKVQFDFKLADGKPVAVWGSAVLFGIMPQAKPGDHMWIKYLGDEPPRRSDMLPKRLFSAEIEEGDEERAIPEDNIAAGDDEKPLFASKGEVANG